MPDNLEIWTVYDHPLDFPHSYIARKWQVGPELVATDAVMVCATLEPIREELASRGLVRIPRSADDDGVILESWL